MWAAHSSGAWCSGSCSPGSWDVGAGTWRRTQPRKPPRSRRAKAATLRLVLALTLAACIFTFTWTVTAASASETTTTSSSTTTTTRPGGCRDATGERVACEQVISRDLSQLRVVVTTTAVILLVLAGIATGRTMWRS